ncbi:hypothetical protein Tco_1381366 [Tanacetum coccineum]
MPSNVNCRCSEFICRNSGLLLMFISISPIQDDITRSSLRSEQIQGHSSNLAIELGNKKFVEPTLEKEIHHLLASLGHSGDRGSSLILSLSSSNLVRVRGYLAVALTKRGHQQFESYEEYYAMASVNCSSKTKEAEESYYRCNPQQMPPMPKE